MVTLFATESAMTLRGPIQFRSVLAVVHGSNNGRPKFHSGKARADARIRGGSVFGRALTLRAAEIRDGYGSRSVTVSSKLTVWPPIQGGPKVHCRIATFQRET